LPSLNAKRGLHDLGKKSQLRLIGCDAANPIVNSNVDDWAKAIVRCDAYRR
jgi:hypothetical protein